MSNHTRTSLLITMLSCLLLAAASAEAQRPSVSVEGDHFLVNGRPRFLIFISHPDAMRARRAGPCTNPSDTSLECDLKYIKETLHFDGIRIFPNWWNFIDVGGGLLENWFASHTLFTTTGLRYPDLQPSRTFSTPRGMPGSCRSVWIQHGHE